MLDDEVEEGLFPPLAVRLGTLFSDRVLLGVRNALAAAEPTGLAAREHADLVGLDVHNHRHLFGDHLIHLPLTVHVFLWVSLGIRRENDDAMLPCRVTRDGV